MATLIEKAKAGPIGLTDAIAEEITGLLASWYTYAVMLRAQDRNAEADLVECWRNSLCGVRNAVEDAARPRPK